MLWSWKRGNSPPSPRRSLRFIHYCSVHKKDNIKPKHTPPHPFHEYLLPRSCYYDTVEHLGSAPRSAPLGLCFALFRLGTFFALLQTLVLIVYFTAALRINNAKESTPWLEESILRVHYTLSLYTTPLYSIV